MGDKKKTEDDSVTVMGLPGHPEKVGKSMSRRGEDIAREAKDDLEDQVEEDVAGRRVAGSTKKSGTEVDAQEPVKQDDEKLLKP